MTHLIIVKPCGQVVEESARNIITAFAGRYSDLEGGDLTHDLLKIKNTNLLSRNFDFRLTFTCDTSTQDKRAQFQIKQV
jgi:hypothetical protein